MSPVEPLLLSVPGLVIDVIAPVVVVVLGSTPVVVSGSTPVVVVPDPVVDDFLLDTL